MKPRKQILLYCCDEFRAAELKLIIETRISARVTIATGIGVVSAVRGHDFHCAVLTHGEIGVIDFLRARDIPTLEIGDPPSYADRCVSGAMMDVLEAVKIMFARKRGPKLPPRYCDHCGKKINRYTGHQCQDAIAEAA